MGTYFHVYVLDKLALPEDDRDLSAVATFDLGKSYGLLDGMDALRWELGEYVLDVPGMLDPFSPNGPLYLTSAALLAASMDALATAGKLNLRAQAALAYLRAIDPLTLVVVELA